MKRRNLCIACLAAIVLFCVAHPTAAAEIGWSTDLDDAWKQAVTQNRPLLIFVSSPGCKYCTLMNRDTYGDAAVAAQIKRSFVPVVIDASRSGRLVRELKVQAFPTTLVVSPRSVLIDRLEGYAPPKQMKQRLVAALELSVK